MTANLRALFRRLRRSKRAPEITVTITADASGYLEAIERTGFRGGNWRQP
jgi:hypothetical protein